MLSLFDRSKIYHHVILLTGLVAAIVILANGFGQDVTKIVGNIMYIPLTATLFALSLCNFLKYKIKGKHGISWVFFMLSAGSWFLAETIWVFYDLVLDIDPFPSSADIFYIVGYPMMFIFMVYYLQPVKKAINKKILFSSIITAICIISPTIYFTITENIHEELSTQILLITYPVLDVIILVPAITGLMLFFRGQVNFAWSMILVGILFMTTGDTLFYFADMKGEYYTGQPIEIMFYWAYLLLMFGVYSQNQIFRTTKSGQKRHIDLRKAH